MESAEEHSGKLLFLCQETKTGLKIRKKIKNKRTKNFSQMNKIAVRMEPIIKMICQTNQMRIVASSSGLKLIH